jgi:hypothetical protein
MDTLMTRSPIVSNLTFNPSRDELPLTEEQRHVFMEVVEESLKISQNIHLFKWLQGGFQYLLGHEVMVFGVKDQHENLYKFDGISTPKYTGSVDSVGSLLSYVPGRLEASFLIKSSNFLIFRSIT